MGRQHNLRPKRSDGLTDQQRDRYERLGKEIQDIYARLRRHKFPNYTPSQSGTNWDKIGQVLDENQISALSYVTWVFNQSKRPYPYPNELLSRVNLDNYKSTHNDKALLEKANRVIQWSTLAVTTELKAGRTLRSVLLDYSLQINPLFRICLANSEKLTALVELFKDSASQFLHTHPIYRKTDLAQFIPEGL